MKLDGMSMDLEKANMEKLRSVFPECFSEQKLDIDKLLSLCGEYIDNDFEKYKFEWKGKAECLRLAQKRSTGTLRPCKEESVNFDETQNLYIEGDNLEVLKLLQTAYYNKIKMIYIDPPYNTGNDFVYEDDFADPMARYKEITGQTTKSNPETMGRYHTNWLNMMYPRLRLAANLLTDDGVIFISIDDNEVFNLKKICDEVFGEENFVAQIPWRKRTAKSDVPFGVSQDYEWIVSYAKTEKFVASVKGKERKYFETEDFPGRPWRFHDLTTQRTVEERPNSDYTMVNPKTGDEYPVNPLRCWAVTKETFKEYYDADKIIFPGDYDFLSISKPVFRYWKEDDMAKAGDSFGRIAVSTKLSDDIGMSQDGTKEITELFENKVFSYPKPTALIKFLASTNTSGNDIILDFFSGSATTAQAVMQLNAEDGGNRKFICVQLPEACDEKSGAYKAGYKNICEIGKERIRRAASKIRNEEVGMRSEENDSSLDTGFKVFKLDDSNLKIWDSTPITGDGQIEMFNERMNSMIDSIKDDRTDMDVVYEIMLKMGIPLDVEVQYIEIDGKIVYIVGDFLLMIALYNNITAEDIEQMAAYAPAKIVCAEQGFKDDTALSNAHYILRDKSIELKLV